MALGVLFHPLLKASKWPHLMWLSCERSFCNFCKKEHVEGRLDNCNMFGKNYWKKLAEIQNKSDFIQLGYQTRNTDWLFKLLLLLFGLLISPALGVGLVFLMSISAYQTITLQKDPFYRIKSKVTIKRRMFGVLWTVAW